MRKSLATLLTALIPFSCAMAETGGLDLNREVKPATAFTAQANAAVYDELDFSDKQEYAFATRGLIDAPETLELKDEDGRMIWSQDAFAFLNDYEKAPDSVNPSLWENTINNHVYGLFEVADGIYQVRGYDMANLTVVKGDTGWIVFDTLMSVECSQAAMQLIEKNLGHFPVKAVVISHSHVDHFGGIAGVMAAEDKADETLSIEEQLASGKIPVIAPAGFTEHAVKENVYAGKGMGRRDHECHRVCRSDEHRRAPAVRRRDGAAWVSGGIRPVAQRIPDRRAGAAPWQRESYGRREEHRRNGQSVVRADAV